MELREERLDVVFKSKAPTPPTMTGLLELFSKLWEELKKKERRTVKALGFGIPGIFSLKEQKIYQSPNYSDLDGLYLRTAISHHIKVPFWIDNDANIAAYGEFRSGAGKGGRHLLLLTLGTGVGSGVIIDGEG